jgi:hypothetical protein
VGEHVAHAGEVGHVEIAISLDRLPAPGTKVERNIDVRQGDQLVRLMEWKWPQDGGVHRAEDRRRRTDAKRGDENRRDRESWAAAQPTRGEAKVSGSVLDPLHSPHIAAPFLVVSGVPELPLCGIPGRGRTQSAALQSLGAQLPVQSHLLLELSGIPVAEQQISKSSKQLARCHDQAGLRMRAMASATRS